MEDNDNVKFPSAYIRKMQNIAKGKTSAINKTVLSINAIIGKKESNMSVRKIRVLQLVYIKQIVADARRFIIF